MASSSASGSGLGNEVALELYLDLAKVCNVNCSAPGIRLPRRLDVSYRPLLRKFLSLDKFYIYPLATDSEEVDKWVEVMCHLRQNNLVAAAKCHDYVFFLLPPDDGAELDWGTFAYRRIETTQRDESSSSLSMSYLQNLANEHEWIFAGIADLFDNASDAQASSITISLEEIWDKNGCTHPMLSIQDNGFGMSHQELLNMVSIGVVGSGNVDRIGRFGIGFKMGAMRLGKDVLVLTKKSDTSSIALLSQSLNEMKSVVQVPFIPFKDKGRNYDTSFQNLSVTKSYMDTIERVSSLDPIQIGVYLGRIKKRKGTLILIWNLDMSLVPDGRVNENEDICISHPRVRTRPGQTSESMVPLDYSLRAYLEVLYLSPRFTMFINESKVIPYSLKNSLTYISTSVFSFEGTRSELTLGRSDKELNQRNCGIFIYLCGRLIEAYKRVGYLLHHSIGCGVIGVIDVTDLMVDENGQVLVNANKQSFLESERYICLVEWLSNQVNHYCDVQFDSYDVVAPPPRNVSSETNEWVQCYKCRKWRRVQVGTVFPGEWFCYMWPYEGYCNDEQEVAGSDQATLQIGEHE